MTTMTNLSVETLTTDYPQVEIPVFESDIFKDHPEAAFFVGALALKQEIGDEGISLPTAYTAARQLRYRSYTHPRNNYISVDSRDEDSGEHDVNDARSVQIGVVENLTAGGLARLVGTARLIIKESPEDLLPVEIDFPEVFADAPAPLLSGEDSRYVAEHEDSNVQHGIANALIRAKSGWMTINEHGPAYAMVEPHLLRTFQATRVPVNKISEFKMIPEYNNTKNAVIRMNPPEVFRYASSLSTDLSHTPAGFGYFDKALGFIDLRTAKRGL